MLPVGQQVRILQPFGDGARVAVVEAVQHVNEAGKIVATPAASVQYVLDDGAAYSPQWLAVVQ